MANKSFIKIKRGLLAARHCAQMGITVWLYLYILDHTDWEEGVFRKYRDGDAADALGVPVRTIRSWRVKLEAGGYIACRQSLHSQTVYISNWSNPKENWGQQDGGQISGSAPENRGEPQVQELVTDIAGLLLNVDATRSLNLRNAILREGEGPVRAALALALEGWKRQKRKDNGQRYSIYNLSWIDWALENLVTGTRRWEVAKPRVPGRASAEELREAGFNVPDIQFPPQS